MKKLFVVLLAAATVLAFSVPVWAAASPGATVTISGRMLTDIGWWSKSEELTTSGKDVSTSFVNMPGHSFLRARWRTADATSGGRIELGLKSLQPTASVSLRYAYGWYRVGKCRILAGQTDNWFGHLAYHPKQYVGLNNNAHLLLFGWGFMWPHRVPQVQFAYTGKSFGIQFAFEEPRYKTAPSGADIYFTFPRMSLTAYFKTKSFMTHPGVLFVQHNFEGVASGQDDSFNTWAFVLPIKFTAGAFTLKFQGHYGVNIATEIPFYPSLTGPVQKADGKYEDTTTLGGMIAVEYKVGALTVTGGFGYEKFQNDEWKDTLGYKNDDQVRKAYFVAVPYQVNKYFGIHPEFAYYDYGDDPSTGQDAGNEWMLGVQFRFIF
jgi:hypothetical protein